MATISFSSMLVLDFNCCSCHQHVTVKAEFLNGSHDNKLRQSLAI